ncbi:MAG TPA: DUF3078 domain-containing protein [Daejeonella sp.]|nr:DUF3078 domain-containing protein [Daejeonella sp.]
MRIRFLLLLIGLFSFTGLYAQETTVADSTLLKELKQFPRKNSLPVRKSVILLEQVELPSADIDIRVNYWRNSITFGLNFNQAAFSNNWKNGGVNSLAFGSVVNYKTDYTKGDKNFTSEILLQYGKLRNKGQLERKLNDRIFWDNKVGVKISKNWDFFASLNFESQFDEGFSFSKNAEGKEIATLLSRFMSPGYLTESVGVEYKPVKYFYVRVGTGTARQTFVLDTNLFRTNPKNFGVVPGKTFRNDLAFQIVSEIDKSIAPNLNLKGRYAMFASYERLSKIDHRLDLALTARFNRFINVSLTGVGLYDNNSANRIQASQTLALGLMYKLNR